MFKIQGYLSKVEYVDTSRNGNSRYMGVVILANGKDTEIVYGDVDSSLNIKLCNLEFQNVVIEAKEKRGKLVITSINKAQENETSNQSNAL